ALPPRHFDSCLVQRPSLLRPAESLQRLAAVKVRGRIIRRRLDQRAKLADRALQVAAVPMLHRQTVPQERIGRVLRHHFLQAFQSGVVHFALCYYTSEVACPFFDPLEPRSRATDLRDAMLPLGDSWAGLCRANPDQPAPPDEAAVRPLCN